MAGLGCFILAPAYRPLETTGSQWYGCLIQAHAYVDTYSRMVQTKWRGWFCCLPIAPWKRQKIIDLVAWFWRLRVNNFRDTWQWIQNCLQNGLTESSGLLSHTSGKITRESQPQLSATHLNTIRQKQLSATHLNTVRHKQLIATHLNTVRQKQLSATHLNTVRQKQHR